MSNNSSFSFTPTKEQTKSEPIKWTINNTKYEVYLPTLQTFELSDIVSHGVTLRNKVMTTVGTAAHRGLSLYEVYSRSLSPVLLTDWEQLNQEADNDPNVNNIATVNHFDSRLREMIAVHATSDNRYELVQSLRACRKPRDLPVQTFWYKLREFNSYVDWIPGNEPALNEQQVKQAFHDAMPPTWQERFANAGNSLVGMTMAQVVQYFRKQEDQAARKMNENNQQQRQQSMSRRRGKNGNPKTTSIRPKEKDNKKGKATTKDKRSRIDNADPCPIHPGMGHTWGKCRANAYNEERTSKRPKKGDDKTDSMAVTVEEVDIIADSLADLSAINDDPSDIGTYSVECYVNVAAIIADHHMNTVSFSAEQEQPKGDFVLDDAFNTMCDEIYSVGDDNITLKTYMDVTASLRLRALGIMTVGYLQRTSNSTPLRCLFDTGSDTTLVNRRALPKGANTRTVHGTHVTGLHGTKQLNQEVLLEDIGFPEFSPTQRIPGPVRAKVFDNPNASYDIIMGMDLMQVLGIDVRCSTKTVTWNDLVIPFRPSNYFDSAATTITFLAEDDPFEEADAAKHGYKSKVILPSK